MANHNPAKPTNHQHPARPSDGRVAGSGNANKPFDPNYPQSDTKATADKVEADKAMALAADTVAINASMETKIVVAVQAVEDEYALIYGTRCSTESARRLVNRVVEALK